MSRRKQAKPRSLKPDEEEWVEEDHTGDIQDALNHSNKDDEETQEEAKRNEMTEKEQDIERKCEDVVEDTANSKKRSENFDYEDVDDIKSESNDSFDSESPIRPADKKFVPWEYSDIASTLETDALNLCMDRDTRTPKPENLNNNISFSNCIDISYSDECVNFRLPACQYTRRLSPYEIKIIF